VCEEHARDAAQEDEEEVDSLDELTEEELRGRLAETEKKLEAKQIEYKIWKIKYTKLEIFR
jgi:hypothetical protein